MKLNKTEYKGVYISDNGKLYINYKDSMGVSRRRKVKCTTAEEAFNEKLRIIGELDRVVHKDEPEAIAPVIRQPRLYYMSLDHEGHTYYKIGISDRVASRMHDFGFDNIISMRGWNFDSIEEARLVEQFILRRYKAYRLSKSPFRGGGDTEFFYRDVLTAEDLDRIKLLTSFSSCLSSK